MNIWEIKTHRHGVQLVPAQTIQDAIAVFETFNRDYLRDINQNADRFKDEIISCVNLGPLIKS